MNEDEKWMRFAIKQAIKAKAAGEVPVGAILIKDGILLAQAHNQPILTNDATAHAEIQLIRAGGRKLKNYRLTETSMYVTLEPCTMCLGAIMHARIKRVIFGARDPKKGVCGSSENFMNASCFNHKVELISGILENECTELLKNFFKSRR